MSKTRQSCALAAVIAAAIIGASSSASAQFFKIHNQSSTPVSVGFATSDTSCESGFRNNLWVNVGAGSDSNVFNFDWINAFLVTAIRANSSGGFSTVLIKDSLSNYNWDTPISGSSDCATFNGPGDDFGYSVFNLSCNTSISHAGMVIIGPPEGAPQGAVGCVVSGSGPTPVPTNCEMHPELPECIPD